MGLGGVCRFANGLLTAASGTERQPAAGSGGGASESAGSCRFLPLPAGRCRKVGGSSSPPSDTTFPQVTALGIRRFRAVGHDLVLTGLLVAFVPRCSASMPTTASSITIPARGPVRHGDIQLIWPFRVSRDADPRPLVSVCRSSSDVARLPFLDEGLDAFSEVGTGSQEAIGETFEFEA